MTDEREAPRADIDEREAPRHEGKPGERGFLCVWTAASGFMLIQSLLLWQEKPGISGPAAIPLIASALSFLLSVFTLIRGLKRGGDGTPMKARFVRALRYALPPSVAVAVGALIAYGALLLVGAPFYAATPVFLWGLMTFLRRGRYLQNILWTAACVACVYLIFNVLFKVVMP